MNRLNRAPVALERFSRVRNMRDLHSSQPARSSRSSTSNPSPSAPANHRGGSSLRHWLRLSPFSSSFFLNAMRLLSLRNVGRHICSSVTPAEYESNRSGRLSCQSAGESASATGVGGGSGVCVDMMYSSGPLNRGSRMNSLGW